MMIFVIAWMIWAAFVGLFARRQGRSAFGYFALSMLISPLLTFLLLLLLGKGSRTHRDCPQCAEQIKRNARLCLHCGYQIPAEELQKQATLAELAAGDRLKAGLFVGATTCALIAICVVIAVLASITMP